MLKKEIFQFVISENNKCLINNSSKNEQDFKWTDDKLRLLEYVCNLCDDDVLDLIALMNYGRQLNAGLDNTSFSKERRYLSKDCLNADRKLTIKDELLFNRNMSLYLTKAYSAVFE